MKRQNIKEESSTGFDTRLTDSLPTGLQLVSGMLDRSTIGRLLYQDDYTNTYVIKANQAGRYTLPVARVTYESIEGDDFQDESMPMELVVVYGQLSTEADITFPRITNEGNIHFTATVFDVDGITPVTDANVYGVVQIDYGGWQNIYTVPMGWLAGSNIYRGMSPAIPIPGNFRAYVVAEKDLYDKGISASVEQKIVKINPDINQDYFVNFLDFLTLARHWLRYDCTMPDWCNQTDINRDGTVDIRDILLMSEKWLIEAEIGIILNGDFEIFDYSRPNRFYNPYRYPPLLWSWEDSPYNKNYVALHSSFVPEAEQGPSVDWEIVAPFEGNYFVLLSTGDAQGFGTEALTTKSSIEQQIEVSPGDVLYGSYFFGTTDYMTWNDTGIIKLIPVNQSQVEIIIVEINVESVGDCSATNGWQHFEYEFTEEVHGEFRLVCEVFDVADVSHKSYFALDNFYLCRKAQ